MVYFCVIWVSKKSMGRVFLVARKKSLTVRVEEELPENLIQNLWLWVDKVLPKLEDLEDSLQFFELLPIDQSALLENQLIIHTVKEIDYKRSHALCLDKNFKCNVCVAISRNSIKMMFLDELTKDTIGP